MVLVVPHRMHHILKLFNCQVHLSYAHAAAISVATLTKALVKLRMDLWLMRVHAYAQISSSTCQVTWQDI